MLKRIIRYLKYPGWVQCIYLREVRYAETYLKGYRELEMHRKETLRNNATQVALDMKGVPITAWRTFNRAEELTEHVKRIAKGHC